VRTRSGAAFATFSGNAANVIVVSLQAVLLIPLYLDAVGPRLYGAWLASGDLLVWMQAIDLGIPNLMIQRVAAAHGRGDRTDAAGWFASGLIVLTLVSLIIGAVGFLISIPLPMWLGVTPAEAPVLRGCFLLGTIAASTTILTNGFVGLSRAIQDTRVMSAMLIASASVGLLTSLLLVLAGWGLWSIALGLVARAAVMLAAGLVFGARTWRAEFDVPFRVDRVIIGHLLAASPATAIGGASYTLMSQSEVVLVAALIRPELAVVYGLTRKAADVGRSLVDMIGFASYGGFAHLLGSADRAQAQTVHAQILRLHLAVAVPVAAAYLAVNHSLVDVWVGPSAFGGILLVGLMALQCVVLGHSYLLNLLFRATGHVVQGSIALVVEALVRLPLLAAMLLAFGLPGLPLASILTALTSAVVIQRRAAKELGAPSFASAPTPRLLATGLVLFAVGFLLALGVHIPSWLYCITAGATIALGGCFILIRSDPLLRRGLASWTNSWTRQR
jgi:O-antigen/teichoic acid export membrane protein